MARNIKNLVGRIDTTCRAALEAAAGLCLSRTHYEIDVEHLLAKLLERDNTDLHRIFTHFDIDPGTIAAEVDKALDGFKSGNTRTPVISTQLPVLLETAWLTASIDLGADRVRSGHLLLALIATPDLLRQIDGSVPSISKVSPDALRQGFLEIVAGSAEDIEVQGVGSPAAAGVTPSGEPGRPSPTPALDQYTVDLTAQAKDGKIDPVLGRSAEIRQVIDILGRRRQNNPILTGEPGVGKTAVVEGLALRIAEGDVPPSLAGVRLLSLDLGLLQAGASVRGEFENRLRAVIDEVKKSATPIILFIDEAHQLVGAGGQAGQGDAANLLKPALARGELKTIAATTWAEYKKYFERDAALARRFQVVRVEEPTPTTAIVMIRGLAAKMSRHHGVRLLDDAVIQAVTLSDRYLTGRQLPDKAVSLLDTACAKVAIGQTSIPAPIDDLRRRLSALEEERQALEREAKRGADVTKRLSGVAADTAADQAELARYEERWKAELEIVAKLKAVYDQIDAAAEGTAVEELKDEGKRLAEELAALQGDQPLTHALVTGQSIAEVLANWTGVPVGRMLKNEIETVLNLDRTMAERVIGQDHGLAMIAQRVRTSRASLEDPNKPIGVFMLVGPSGVGKTETALTLAELLYGGERNLITINMSEFQEAHTVSSLKGSPPGYVGYGEGGVLTEAVRRKPYSVVLLDEVEKAHPDVLELFFQVFDKGVLDDGEGRTINFKNTIILLTSNAASQTIVDACRDPAALPTPEALVGACWAELEHVFKPAFLGRTVVIPYYPVMADVLKQIVRLKLGKIQKRFAANHGAELSYGEPVLDAIVQRCGQVGSGARLVDNILTNTLLPRMSEAVLQRMVEAKPIERVVLGLDEAGHFAYEIA